MENSNISISVKNTDRRSKTGTLCCIFGAVCWGFSGTCSQALFQHIPVNATWVTAVRMLAAGLLILAFDALKQKKRDGMFSFSEFSAPMRDRKSCVLISLFAVAGLAFCQLAYLDAIKYTNSGTATVLQNLSVVMIALFVCITSRTMPAARQVVSILLALVGVWLVATGGKPGSMVLTPRGLFWGLVAAVGAMCYTLLSRAPVVLWGSIRVTGWGMLIGGILMAFISKVWQTPHGMDAEAVILLVVIVAVGTVGAFILFLRGINEVGPVKASVFGCMEPLTAALLSAVWLGSSFSVADIAGFAFILSTIFILRK